jgi:hypothetical protein
MSEIDYCVSQFHPTLPVLVCGFNRVFLLNAEDVSVPFSEWKEREISFDGQGKGLKIVTTLEWNVSFIFMPLKKRVEMMYFDSTKTNFIFNFNLNFFSSLTEVNWPLAVKIIL